MSCVAPCLTCSSSLFNLCLTCDTSINNNYTLNGSLCLESPVWYIQLAGTCMLGVFILLPLFRKRCMVLMKLFDAIQIVSFLKYLNNFIEYRKNFLYLEMRSMNPWNEGWQLLSMSNDVVSPIFTT